MYSDIRYGCANTYFFFRKVGYGRVKDTLIIIHILYTYIIMHSYYLLY